MERIVEHKSGKYVIQDDRGWLLDLTKSEKWPSAKWWVDENDEHFKGSIGLCLGTLDECQNAMKVIGYPDNCCEIKRKGIARKITIYINGKTIHFYGELHIKEYGMNPRLTILGEKEVLADFPYYEVGYSL